MVVLFVGPSGSGKDTQAQLLAIKSSFQNVSTGDLLRDISNGASSIQTYVKKALNDGWMNDSLTYGLLQVHMKYSRGDDFILNGAVRTVPQISLLDNMLNLVGQKVDHVFNFTAPKEVLLLRLSNRLYCKVCKSNYNLQTNPPRNSEKCDKCGSILFAREDDNEKSIEIRLNEFEKNNTQILDEYNKRGIVTSINANRSINEIHLELNDHISKLIENEQK